MVDDDAEVRVILAAMLEAAGHEVATSDGALRIVKDVDALRPDLVLLDYSMPGFPGAKAIRLLRHMTERQLLPPTPVALMSTDAPQDVLAEARQEGAIAYIDKSIGADGICSAVDAILATRLA